MLDKYKTQGRCGQVVEVLIFKLIVPTLSCSQWGILQVSKQRHEQGSQSGGSAQSRQEIPVIIWMLQDQDIIQDASSENAKKRQDSRGVLQEGLVELGN